MTEKKETPLKETVGRTQLSPKQNVSERSFSNRLKKFVKRPIFKILLIGLFVRIAVMLLFTHPYDIWHWTLTMQHVQAGAGLYGINGYWYSPPWGYLLSIWANVMDLFGVSAYGYHIGDAVVLEYMGAFEYSATITTISFNFFVKVPLIIADIIVGYVIYKIIFGKTKDEKKATYGFALWFLCPLIIFNSAVHAMFDNIVVLFMLISIYSIFKGYDFLAGASLAVSILLKVFPLVLIFALIAFIIKEHKGDTKTVIKRLSIAALGLFVVSLIIYVPQILDGTVTDSLRFLTNRLGASVTLPDSNVDIFRAIIDLFSSLAFYLRFIIVALAPVIAYKMIYKGKDTNNGNSLFSCVLITMTMLFLIPTAPQYLVVAAPFMIFFVTILDKRFILPFMIATTAALFYTFIIPNFTILSSLAAYTDLMDMNTIISFVGWINGPAAFGASKQTILFFIPWVIQFAGMIMAVVYWFRYEKGAAKSA